MELIGYLASILIGVSLGLIGGGGSILTVPVLVYLLGVEPVLATAYSLFCGRKERKVAAKDTECSGAFLAASSLRLEACSFLFFLFVFPFLFLPVSSLRDL